MYAPRVLQLAKQRLEGVCEPAVHGRVGLSAIYEQDCSRASGFGCSSCSIIWPSRGISPATAPVSIRPIAYMTCSMPHVLWTALAMFRVACPLP